jgi:hypothetical protein
MSPRRQSSHCLRAALQLLLRLRRVLLQLCHVRLQLLDVRPQLPPIGVRRLACRRQLAQLRLRRLQVLRQRCDLRVVLDLRRLDLRPPNVDLVQLLLHVGCLGLRRRQCRARLVQLLCGGAAACCQLRCAMLRRSLGRAQILRLGRRLVARGLRGLQLLTQRFHLLLWLRRVLSDDLLAALRSVVKCTGNNLGASIDGVAVKSSIILTTRSDLSCTARVRILQLIGSISARRLRLTTSFRLSQ